MNKTYSIHATIAGLLLLGALAACNDKEMCDLPHPHPGNIAFTLDWGNATPQEVQTVLLPYTDRQDLPSPDAPVTDPDRLAPGRYHLLAYTATAENLEVRQGTATVTNVGADGFLPPVGELYAGYADLTVGSEETTRVTLTMQPRTRLLQLTLRVAEGEADRVQSLTATLQGVLASRVIDPVLASATTASRAGEATGSISLTFTPDAGGSVYTAAHRLLGFDPEARLLLSVTLTDTEGGENTHTYDVTDPLRDFNNPPTGTAPNPPFELEGSISLPPSPDPEEPETPEEPSPATPQFSIGGWQPATPAQGGADMEIPEERQQ